MHQIWNEPDDEQTYVPPLYFGQMLQQSYSAIKSSDSSATVVVGGLNSGNPNYLAEALKATGGKLYADAVGLHPYGWLLIYIWVPLVSFCNVYERATSLP